MASTQILLASGFPPQEKNIRVSENEAKSANLEDSSVGIRTGMHPSLPEVAAHVTLGFEATPHTTKLRYLAKPMLAYLFLLPSEFYP